MRSRVSSLLAPTLTSVFNLARSGIATQPPFCSEALFHLPVIADAKQLGESGTVLGYKRKRSAGHQQERRAGEPEGQVAILSQRPQADDPSVVADPYISGVGN